MLNLAPGWSLHRLDMTCSKFGMPQVRCLGHQVFVVHCSCQGLHSGLRHTHRDACQLHGRIGETIQHKRLQ